MSSTAAHRRRANLLWLYLCVAAAATHAVGLSCAFGAGANAAVELRPGAEAAVRLLDTADPVKVRLPANYDAARAWPVIVFYHGVNGVPDTALFTFYTGGRDFIVVGMPFIEKGAVTRSAEEEDRYQSAEMRNFGAVMDWLGRHARVDGGCVIMAGLSKGGWAVSSFGERMADRLAGMVILLAGRRVNQPCAAPAALKGKPVYVGNGETDDNITAGRQAAQFYARAGAQVCAEEYAGLGHEAARHPPLLLAWLQALDPLTGAERKGEAREWYERSRDRIKAEQDPGAKYRLLEALSLDPRLRLCGAEAQASVQAALDAARARSPMREECAARRAYDELIWRDYTIRRLSDMKAVLDGFRELAQTYPQTRWGRLANDDAQRVGAAYEKSLAATRKAAADASAKTEAAKPPAPVRFPAADTNVRVPARKANRVEF